MHLNRMCRTSVVFFEHPQEHLSAHQTQQLTHEVVALMVVIVDVMQDKYGTQRVVSFLRQLTEQGGFWRASDKSWVKLNRVQFVGACNPPTDAGVR